MSKSFYFCVYYHQDLTIQQLNRGMLELHFKHALQETHSTTGSDKTVLDVQYSTVGVLITSNQHEYITVGTASERRD